MKLPFDIQFRGLEPSEALSRSARDHARKLEWLMPDILTCRVGIDLTPRPPQQGRPIGVRIDLTVPGHELVVNRAQHEDPYVGLNDAFDNMKRQLEELVQKRRGQVKLHAPTQRRGPTGATETGDENSGAGS